ncbi:MULTISPECIES: response regulator [unclassified Oleiphilus]|nr:MULTISPECIES: response regulator [unclassified Oleiphilus]
MTQAKTLNQRIRQTTLRRFVPIVLSIALITVITTFFIINFNIGITHEQYLDDFEKRLNERLSSLDEQVESLARNDLIINSLIDFSNRESYLPVFFRSLQPINFIGDKSNFSIVFTDFEGELITGNNHKYFANKSQMYDWKSSTLEDGLHFRSVDKNGIFIAFPVIYGPTPEGAIVLYVEKLSDVIQLDTEDYSLELRQNEDLIYRSGPVTDDSGMGSIITSHILGTLKLSVIQSNLDVYKDAAWVVGLMLGIFALVVIALVNAIGLASTTASDIINLLKSKIVESRHEDDFKLLTESENESSEITELRNAFNQLIEGLFTTTKIKERVEDVIDSLDEMLVVFDLNYNNFMSNNSFNQLYSEINQDNRLDRPSDIFPRKFLSSDEQSRPITQSFRISDVTKIVSWHKTLYKDRSDKVIGIVITGVDITKSEQLKQELSIKNQAIDEAQTPIIISDATEQGFPITYVNKAFERQTGYAANEVIGRNCGFLQGQNTQPHKKALIKSALRNFEPITVNIINYKKSGEEFHNQLSLTPIRNHDNLVTHVLGFQQDVTHQEKTQQYLEDAKFKAEESAQLKSEFLASMSHEIRTPMNGILGMLGLLESSSLTKEQIQHVKLAKSSADALLVLINDILDFSKIEAGKLTLENVAFDIVNLLSDVSSSIACVSEDKSLELILDTSELNAHQIKGDPGRIRQILINLIGNAIKFTEHGSVTIKASNSAQDGNDTIYVSIIDTGVGIPQDRISAIFESFSQVDTSTTRKFGGTGLGLTICKQLAELMDGDITVESDLGEGSVFTLAFKAEIERSNRFDISQFSDINALIIDSCERTASVIEKQLTTWGVSSKKLNSDELKDGIKSFDGDICFLSNHVIGQETKGLIESIRSHSNHTHICMLTKLADLRGADQINSLGADSYFPKPATHNDLYDALMSISMQAEESYEREGEPDISKEDHRDYGGLKVLLVEDNPINQILAVTLLEGLGLSVEVANHGVEALEKMSNEPSYGMIFMDCQMPEMDGYETTQNIRKGECGESYKDIPIIAMTANAIDGDREKCLEAGMSDYITKPIDTDILHDRVAHWFAQINK